MALKGNKNALGNKGNSSLEREQYAHVKRLLYKEIVKVLNGEDDSYRRQLVLKLAGNFLPRPVELSGGNGESLEVIIKKM